MLEAVVNRDGHRVAREAAGRLSLLLLTAGACGVGDSHILDAAPRHGDAQQLGSCAATTVRLYAFGGMDEVSATIADVTGDGVDDVVTIFDLGNSSYRVEIGEPAVAELILPHYLLSVGAADLDADGQNDLVIGALWADQVQVFRGPLAGDVSGSAMLTINGPDNDGLALLMGAAVLVADVNGDGTRDLVVTAPAEAEEACAGTELPRVYLGPFAAAAVLEEEDVDFRLNGPGAFSCLGETASCTALGLELSARPDPVCYEFPVPPADPRPCP
jgi:hypothetical protein